MNGNHECQDFETVERAELDALNASDEPLVGLAFSGGGIRSATFNLGILQALARCGLLKRFHYLRRWLHRKLAERLGLPRRPAQGCSRR